MGFRGGDLKGRGVNGTLKITMIESELHHAGNSP